jgi:hypothetical protein
VNATAVGQFERKRPRFAIEPSYFDWDSHLRAKLGGLRESPPSQRATGYRGRKAQIILDTGALTGLATIGARIENDDRKAVRRSIHSRRWSGGGGADRGHIVSPIRGIDLNDARAR